MQKYGDNTWPNIQRFNVILSTIGCFKNKHYNCAIRVQPIEVRPETKATLYIYLSSVISSLFQISQGVFWKTFHALFVFWLTCGLWTCSRLSKIYFKQNTVGVDHNIYVLPIHFLIFYGARNVYHLENQLCIYCSQWFKDHCQGYRPQELILRVPSIR